MIQAKDGEMVKMREELAQQNDVSTKFAKATEEIAAYRVLVENMRNEQKKTLEAHTTEVESLRHEIESLKGHGASSAGALALHAVRLETQLVEERAKTAQLQRELEAQAVKEKQVKNEYLQVEENSELELARMGSLLNAEQRISSGLRNEVQALKSRVEQHNAELELAALPANKMADQVERLQTQLQEAKVCHNFVVRTCL